MTEEGNTGLTWERRLALWSRDDALTGNASTQGRLTDLVTYKTQVESTREWFFDSSTLWRFGLYLLIPVASMVGGALVERLVAMVLD